MIRKEEAGEKYPFEVNVELETFSLVRLELISDTYILLELVSTQKRRFLKISIYHLAEKD
jgi:hypothetical protein